MLRAVWRLVPPLFVLCGLALLIYAGGHPLAPQVHSSVYVDGLVNPRGLAFDDRGVLYVAEAGSGGSRKVALDEREQFEVGSSGRVSRVPAAGRRETLADGLPSIYSQRHGDYLGPAAVATIGTDVYALIATGWCGLPEYDNTLMRFGPDGTRVTLLDYSAQTLADPPLARREDPRADVPGGVPFGLLALGGKLYTTDGNLEFVQEYSAEGRPLRRLLEYPLSIHVLTGITAGPDGAIYLSEMGFWPYPPGGGQVTRLPLDGQAAPAATGITAAIAATFGPDGTLYALEHSSPLKQAHNTGRLVRVRPDGPPEPLLEGLNLPTALATGPDGSLYLSDGGNRTPPGQGRVLRVELEPATPWAAAVEHARRLGLPGLAAVTLLVLAGAIGLSPAVYHRMKSLRMAP